MFVAKQNEIPLGTMLLNCPHVVAIALSISCWDVSRQFFAYRLSVLGGARVCNFCEKKCFARIRSHPVFEKDKTSSLIC